jgi:nicotinamide mononucleotide (NMN) deamidase PncC
MSAENHDGAGQVRLPERPHPLGLRVHERLIERGLTLALAESCTGGLIADLITDISGSSA